MGSKRFFARVSPFFVLRGRVLSFRSPSRKRTATYCAKEILVNYYGAKELAESARTVRKNTVAIAREIPEEKYSFRPAAEPRSGAELFAHIALSPSFLHQVHGEERRTT